MSRRAHAELLDDARGHVVVDVAGGSDPVERQTAGTAGRHVRVDQLDHACDPVDPALG
jgi:hypothetical protein